MKNLENLNLQELSFEEQTNTDGGVIPFVAIGIGWGVMTGLSIVGVAIADKHNVKIF